VIRRISQGFEMIDTSIALSYNLKKQSLCSLSKKRLKPTLMNADEENKKDNCEEAHRKNIERGR